MYLFTVYTTLVHCVYNTCSLCQLEVFTSLVDGQGGTDLEWLGYPSPPLTLGRGKRERPRDVWIDGNIGRKLRTYGEREIMGAGGKCVNASVLGNLT